MRATFVMTEDESGSSDLMS